MKRALMRGRAGLLAINWHRWRYRRAARRRQQAILNATAVPAGE